MSEWKPIDTAPKDGTRILAFWPDSGDGVDNEAEARTWWENDRWENPWGSSLYDPPPTHWMPLPPPPGEGDTSNAGKETRE